MSNVNFDNLFASLTQISSDVLLEKGLSAAGESEDIVTAATSSDDGKIIFFGYTDNDDKNTGGILSPHDDDGFYAIVGDKLYRNLEPYFDTSKVWSNHGKFVFKLEDSKIPEFIDKCKQLMSLNKRLMNITFNKPE